MAAWAECTEKIEASWRPRPFRGFTQGECYRVLQSWGNECMKQ